ncbi:hypothetical protein VE02_04993 [Pseudogymnoascus sp. 03VT05]|nr:hypothetical protein VE02_04993 [Pseudogymnoascus sp. 03VT05]
MANEPSISIRKSIRWGDDAAFEDTSTLVLTTGPRRYVDLRVYLPEKPEDGLPNADHVPALDRLEWGFAGKSKGTPAEWDGPRLVTPAHGTWTHWVDSQKPDGYEDDGFMYDQHDGLTWEKGVMEYPKTGKLTPYEEVWEDFAPAKDAAGNMIAVTLVYAETGNSAKGMVIRVGDWIQGILRDAAGSITVERWHFETASKATEGWKRVVRIGSGELPCQRLFALDNSTTVEGSGWTILKDDDVL